MIDAFTINCGRCAEPANGATVGENICVGSRKSSHYRIDTDGELLGNKKIHIISGNADELDTHDITFLHVRLVEDADGNLDVIFKHLSAVEIVACIARHGEKLEELGRTVIESAAVKIKLHIIYDGLVGESLEIGTDTNGSLFVNEGNTLFVEQR